MELPDDAIGTSDPLAPLDRYVAQLLTGSDDGAVQRTLLSGGLSQSTIKYEVPGREIRPVVVKLPPAAGPLEPFQPTVEAELLGALRQRGLAVPDVVALESTGDVVGQPFYVTAFDHGAMTTAGHIEGDGDADVSAMAAAFVDQLVALHTLDVEERVAGEPRSLSDILEQTPEKSPKGNLDRWAEAMQVADFDLPSYHAFLERWLYMRMPNQSEGTEAVVHGDYRLGNVLWRDVSTLAAVMDWEDAGLGDPYFDLGWTLMGAVNDDDPVFGICSRRWLLDRYAAGTGKPIDQQRLAWWEIAAGVSRLCMDAKAIALLRDGRYRDIRPMLSVYMNRKLSVVLLDKVLEYERRFEPS